MTTRECITSVSREGKLAWKIFFNGCLASILACSATARDETVSFNFAPMGTSFSAFLGPDDPLVGQEIISARIYLDVISFPGSNATNFFTDLSLPIDPLPGNENAIVLFGSELGWSGSGSFHYFEETTRFNGFFVPARFGGETPGENFNGLLLMGSRIELDVVPEPGMVFLLVFGVASVAGRRLLFKSRRERSRQLDT